MNGGIKLGEEHVSFKCSQATSITYGGCVFTSGKLKTKRI